MDDSPAQESQSLDAQSRSQRSRVTQACDACRQFRRRCDSNVPSCYSCIVHRQECTYTHQNRKRGKPTGYIWALEVTIAMLLDEDPGLAQIIRQFVDSTAPDRDHDASIYNQNLARRLHAAWRAGSTAREISSMLGGDDPPPINYRPSSNYKPPNPGRKGVCDSRSDMEVDELFGGCQWPLL